MFKIEKPLFLSTLSIGFSSVISQIVLLREFLSVFYGNELVIGIVLSNWMLLTGFGAFIGKICERRKVTAKHLIAPFFALAVLPLLTVFLLNYLRNIVFITGSVIGIVQIFYSSFILLFPYCIVSGLSFTLSATIISASHQSNLINKVYAIESAGSIIGGMILNFILVYFLETLQSLSVLLVINLCISVYFAFKYSRKIIALSLSIISVAILTIVFTNNFEQIAKRFLYKGQNIIYYKDTPYGNLVITKEGEQKNFFENNVLLFSTDDPVTNEEAVHYTMIQHQNPQNVLLIGGGISGTTKEILKYGIEKVDYVEINPWIIDIGKKYTDALKDKRINIVNEDGRLFIRRSHNRYDVVLINLPEPITAQINRFYTVDFFGELKAKLKDGAVISLSLLPATDYVSHDARKINSIMYNSLKKIFKNVLIVPGTKNYFIASDNSLNINIGKMIEQHNINNVYVNKYYIDDELLRQRNSYIQSNIETKTQTNKDFNPISYYRQIQYWLSYFDVNYWMPAVLLLFILCFLFLKSSEISFGIFCAGFAASSIEILLLITFQIVYGYVYQITGIIITVFMLGLTIGSLYNRKGFSPNTINNFIRTQFYISIYSFVLPIIFIILKYSSLSVLFVHSMFYMLTFIIAFLVGLEFSLASKMEKGSISRIASKIYSADLIGSAFGAILVSSVLIPLMGIIQVSIVIGLVNFFSGMITYKSRNKYLSLL